MKRLEDYARSAMKTEEPLVLAGDYNVIPQPRDARFPENWTRDALFLPQTRAAFSALKSIGLTDGYRALHPLKTGVYSFWDYQAGAWQKDNGILIDHLLLSPQAADKLVDAGFTSTCAAGRSLGPCAGHDHPQMKNPPAATGGSFQLTVY